VVSPADGHVTHIEEAEEPAFLGGPALRISIFLSIFDVHLNRAPLDGRVAYVQYREGGFLNAMRSDSAASNEANDIGLETDEPRAPRVLVRQIAGLIARRIVCEAAPGASLRRGEVFGMIKFGSRTDLFLPRDSGLELRVKVGDAVRAGATVLGELPA
jgi:phosphatidylserine decarboxylase